MSLSIDSIEKYGISLSIVTEADAEFIVGLRKGERNQFISSSDELTVAKQIQWIKQYKIREARGWEYYFVVKDYLGRRWGTTRLYNFSEKKFEIGSWVFKKDSPADLAIKGDILGREFGFEQLNFEICTFEVRKNNKQVLRYHYRFEPNLINEDELNYYFELSKEKFYSHSLKLLRLL